VAILVGIADAEILIKINFRNTTWQASVH